MKKTIFKKIISITLVIVAISLNLVVYAQVIVTQIDVNDKIKEFLKIDSIEIISNYIEGEINIFKVHDSINDRYYKLALDKDKKLIGMTL